MDISLINPTEIEDLIKEVGETVYIVKKNVKQDTNYEYGISEQYEFNEKITVKGYTVQDNKVIVFNDKRAIRSGALTLYVLENKKGSIYESLMNSNTVAVIRNLAYDFELNDVIYHRSKPLIYKLKIESGIEATEATIQNNNSEETNFDSQEDIKNAFNF